MDNVWTLFPALMDIVRKQHEKAKAAAGHHPFEHALMVAQYALKIAEDGHVGKLAAIAALLHNTDRIVPESDVESSIRSCIRLAWERGCQHASGVEVEAVVEAVLNHHKKNDPLDSSVSVCLKDADRLANLSPFDITARSARFYRDEPLVDPRYVWTVDPASTYLDPKTVFRNAIHSTLEWETWLRLPKAREIAKPYFDGLRLIQSLVARQLVETGMNGYR
jgi:hypothetical protein